MYINNIWLWCLTSLFFFIHTFWPKSLRFNQFRFGSHFFSAFFWGQSCHEWRKVSQFPNLKLVGTFGFPDRPMGSFHSYILNSALSRLDVSDFFAKLKDWVISVSFPSFPDVKDPLSKCQFFPYQSWRPLNMQIWKKKWPNRWPWIVLTNSRWKDVYWKGLHVLCRLPLFDQELRGRKERLFCIFCLKRSFVEKRFKIVCTPPPKKKVKSTVFSTHLWNTPLNLLPKG